MSLSPTELLLIVEELDAGLRGANVQKVRVSAGPRVELELRKPQRSLVLVLSGETGAARLGLKNKGEGGGEAPLPVQKLLRTELTGARIESLRSEGPLQVAVLLRRADRQRTLWLDLQRRPGRWALLTEASANGRVLASSDPGLRPGSAFLPPSSVAEPSTSFASHAEGQKLRALDDGEPFPLARAAEQALAGESRMRRVEALRQALSASARQRLKRLARTREKVRDEASRMPLALEHRLKGELITQNLGRISRKEVRVILTHYSEEGPREVAVTLDPKRTPKEQAEWHFHQYRRLQRGVGHAERRLEELDAEAAGLSSELEAILALSEEELLARAASNPALAAPRKKVGPPRARPYREFRTERGEVIWVGKGSIHNDALTFHVAQPHDLWLHALGVEGAHVVVPRNRDAVVPPELLLDAAHLALHASKARAQGGGEVAYTPAKFVRKPKGSAPGAVIYTREKVIAVRMDPERLAKLLKSATDTANEP